MNAERSPRWDDSFESPQGLFELMDRTISPGCPIQSHFSCYVMDVRESRLLWNGSLEHPLQILNRMDLRTFLVGACRLGNI